MRRPLINSARLSFDNAQINFSVCKTSEKPTWKNYVKAPPEIYSGLAFWVSVFPWHLSLVLTIMCPCLLISIQKKSAFLKHIFLLSFFSHLPKQVSFNWNYLASWGPGDSIIDSRRSTSFEVDVGLIPNTIYTPLCPDTSKPWGHLSVVQPPSLTQRNTYLVSSFIS